MPINVLASGLSIPGQGAVALGMSAAMTARSEDLSAFFYNPAGIDYIKNNELYCGLTPIFSRHKFEESDFSAESKKIFLPYNFFTAFRINEKVVIGLGIYTPFGIGTNWGKSWNGRYTSTYGEMSTVFINPAITYQLNNILTIGFGISYVISSVTIKTMIDSGLQIFHYGFVDSTKIALQSLDTEFSMKGTGSALNYNLGILIRPKEKLQFGISYRRATDIDYKGRAKFNHANSLYAPLLSIAMPPSQKGKTILYLPWMLNIGVKYDITDVWDTSMDVNYVGWSVYEKVIIDLAQNKPYDEITMDKDWKDTIVIRMGSSYDVNKVLTVRCGTLYEQSPVPNDTFDALLPDNNCLGFSLGLGYTIGAMTLNTSYTILKNFDREKDNFIGYQDLNGDGSTDSYDKEKLDLLTSGYPVGNGTYKSTENLFSLSLSYIF